MYKTELAAFELLHPLCKIMERIVGIKGLVKIVGNIIAEAGEGPLILIRMGIVKIGKTAAVSDDTETFRFKLPWCARFHFNGHGPYGAQVMISFSHELLQINRVFEYLPVFAGKTECEKEL